MIKSKESLMIIEDNHDFGNLLLKSLTSGFPEYDIKWFKSAAEAVEQFQNGFKPLCGWVDIILPDFNGTELSKHILNRQPEVKLIAMTGYTDPSLIKQALRYGFMDCIEKPFKADSLQEITKLAIERYIISKRKTLMIQDVKMMMEGGQSFQFSSVLSLITMLEKQSGVLQNISFQLTETALKIGASLDLNETDIKLLRYAALLYDIGILPEEDINEETKRNTTTTSTFTLFKLILYIVRNIYEWYDGAGFPKQIKGENIPKLSRIISVAYGFTYLIMDRKHQKGLTEKHAFEEINSFKGKQYDPTIVETLEKILRKEKRI